MVITNKKIADIADDIIESVIEENDDEVTIQTKLLKEQTTKVELNGLELTILSGILTRHRVKLANRGLRLFSKKPSTLEVLILSTSLPKLADALDDIPAHKHRDKSIF